MNSFRICILISLIGPCLPIFAQSNRLNTTLQRLARDPDLRTASWGFCVKDLSNGNMIAEYQAQTSLVTASVMKAVTTATCLMTLGPDYQYKTQIGYTGTRNREGVISGDLIITGSGDPTLGSDRFENLPAGKELVENWGKKIQQAGITAIQGNLVCDLSDFGSQTTPVNWSWEDLGNYYGAGASGLNFHENLYYLDFRSGTTPGTQTQILRTRPPVPELSFANEVTAGPRGSGDNAYIFGAPYTWQRVVRGTIPPGRSVFTIKGSLPDPARHFLSSLKDYLTACSIPVKGEVQILTQSHSNTTLTPIFTHSSPLLSDIIQETNYESINLYAEALLKTLGKESSGKGTTTSGLKEMDSFWKDKGLDTKGMILRDGSGLSPNNVITPLQLTNILMMTYKHPYGRTFMASLPVAGESGNIKGMLKGTSAQGKIHMKSGYLSHVRGYAGFVETRSGKTLAFSMMANHYTCSAGKMRRLFELLLLDMARL